MDIFLFGLAIAAYFLLHSLLAANRLKQFVTDKLLSVRYYRLIYNSIFLLLIVPIVLFYQSIGKQPVFERSLLNEVPGWALALTGVVLMNFALKNYKLSEFSGTYQLKHGKDYHPSYLNTSGLNSYVRHPLYFASLLFFFGIFLAFPNDAVLTLSSVAIGYLIVGTKLEERKLVEVFGQRYMDYQKKVPMLIPKIWSKRKSRS